MRLLIITQKVDQNDDVLGFMHGWIAEFAKHCEQVTVIGLSVRDYDLPSNVKVFSLGKEIAASRRKYLWNFYRIIFRERNNYDAVFVHMNEQYVLLGFPLWKLMHKSVGLWYAHGNVSLSLRIAEQLADIIFTSTKTGFRLSSKKVHIVGQGIDMERFALTGHTRAPDDPLRLIVVGRISPVKDYETTLRAVALLKEQGKNVTLDIVGGAGLPEQQEYFKALKKLTSELHIDETVRFHGGLPNSAIGTLLARAHIFVSTSHTGSFDKAIGEAMATGLPILTCNEAFAEVLGEYASALMFSGGDVSALVKKIEDLSEQKDEDRAALGHALRDIIVTKHSLSGFVQKILSYY